MPNLMVVITKMPRAKFWSRFIIVGLSDRQSHIPFNPYLTELSCVLSNKRPNFQNCFQTWWVDARGHNNRDKPRKCILQIKHFPVDSQPIVKLSFLFASWTSSFGTHISAPKLINYYDTPFDADFSDITDTVYEEPISTDEIQP